MEQAEYCEPGARANPLARVPGNPRLLLIAVVVSILGLPLIALDAIGGSGAGSVVVEAAGADTPPSTAVSTSQPKVIQALSDGPERIEAAYEASRSHATSDDVSEAPPTTAAADDEPSTTSTTAAPPPTTAAPTTAAPAPAPAPLGDVWTRLAYCESGGDWAHQGSYHGGLQFHPSTWVAFGGQAFAPYAYLATPSQQITVAQRVVDAAGGTFAGWPGCRRKLGLP
jgi:Transglycosylase-like domain